MPNCLSSFTWLTFATTAITNPSREALAGASAARSFDSMSGLPAYIINDAPRHNRDHVIEQRYIVASNFCFQESTLNQPRFPHRTDSKPNQNLCLRSRNSLLNRIVRCAVGRDDNELPPGVIFDNVSLGMGVQRERREYHTGRGQAYSKMEAGDLGPAEEKISIGSSNLGLITPLIERRNWEFTRL